MKVALCISGHLREYEKCFPSIKDNIIDKFDTDIFISTWSEPGYWTSDDSRGVDNRDKTYSDIHQKIVELYKPVMLDVEDLRSAVADIDTIHQKILSRQENNTRWGRPRNIVGMYYKIWRCNTMRNRYEKEKNIKYDLVIRCRPDLDIEFYHFHKPTDNTIQLRMDDNTLFSDLIFCGPPDVMDKISSILPSLDIICKETKCLFDPHDILERSTHYFSLRRQFVYGCLGIYNTPSGYCIEDKSVSDKSRYDKQNASDKQSIDKNITLNMERLELMSRFSDNDVEKNTPIHLRNPDTNPVIFDHPNIISYFAKWWKVNTFVEFGVAEQYTTKAVAPYCKRYIGVDMANIKNEVSNFEFYKMRTDEFIKNILPTVGSIDMAFIDANHQSEVVMDDFRGLFPYLVEDGMIFLHDTYPIRSEYTADHYCSDSYRVPDMIKKEFNGKVEVLTIPIQPGLTMVRKTTRKLDHMK